MDRKVIALLDRPSSESFGMCALIIEGDQRHQVLGLTRSETIPREEFERLYGEHILKVDSQLPEGLYNPVALWLGNQFCAKAEHLRAPSLPNTKTWNSPLEPQRERGRYTIRSSQEAYGVLDEWVTATGIEALTREDYDLAKLMNWVLPSSPVTQAVLYFTAPRKEGRQQELEWQIRRDPKVTVSDLILVHERTRNRLLNRSSGSS